MPQKNSIISMTGFGRGSASGKKFRASVEVRTVNSRYLEIRSKLPRPLSFLEPLVREKIEKKITRGVVDVNLQLHLLDPSESLPIDETLANAYVDKAREYAKAWNCADGVTGMTILKFPGVLGAENASFYESEEEIPKIISASLEDSLDGLLEMRKKEGEKLLKVLQRELADFQEYLSWIFENRASINAKYAEKLKTRIHDWSQKSATPIDENRLLQEVTYYLDRSDITEELDRLDSHLKQAHEALSGGGKRSSGKRLEFLAQEMGREVNTIGAKSDHAQVSNRVVEMKLILEKVREQVQNLE